MSVATSGPVDLVGGAGGATGSKDCIPGMAGSQGSGPLPPLRAGLFSVGVGYARDSCAREAERLIVLDGSRVGEWSRS